MIMDDQFSRTRLLIGEAGVDRLGSSWVAVFGIGGVGSFAVEALARAGIGKLTLVDYDVICLSNLNRQLPALMSTLGKAKVDVIKQRLLDINPNLEIDAVRAYYSPDQGEQFLAAPYDYIVDAMDTVPSKVDLIERCFLQGRALVSCMGAGNRTDPTGFTIADISETSGCPLAKIVRKQLRKKGIKKGVKVVYSPKPPLKVCEEIEAEKNAGAGKILGSISFVPPVIGMIAAGAVINDLLAGSS
jgi:tRNA A37 threonylcarbamoyladenosine dehydratase